MDRVAEGDYKKFDPNEFEEKILKILDDQTIPLCEGGRGLEISKLIEKIAPEERGEALRIVFRVTEEKGNPVVAVKLVSLKKFEEYLRFVKERKFN